MRTTNRIRIAKLSVISVTAALAILFAFRVLASGPGIIRNNARYPDPTGFFATFDINGSISLGNPFFESLGTNGRSCSTCHSVADGFGLSAADAQARYASTSGTDPLFASIDGANCPTGGAGTSADNSLVLNNGLIRFSIPATLMAAH
jgi:cytochrome c peroxidase